MQDALDVVGVVVLGAVGIRDCADPEVASYITHVRSDEHIVPLTHSNAENVGVVRLDGNEIGSNDLQSVVVNREVEVSVGSTVDYAEQVDITFLHGRLKSCSTIGASISTID